MRKDELIDILVGNFRKDAREMKKMKKAELEELLEECNDDGGMFPNGRDFEAENEDGPC